MTSKDKPQGFVLIEAIVAVLVVSICLTLISQSLLTNFRTGNRFQEGVRTVIAMESKLGALFVTGGAVDQFNLSGSQKLEAPFERYSLDTKLRVLDEHVKEATLTLSWFSGSKERNFNVSTIIYNPKDVKTQTRML